ncbi:MAG: sulfite exporter TauE/SafE family protein [Nitrococcus sp.]|nr:sulfite exporter TauE/SafE family protein [Nitrococcus sp.]
MTVDLLADLPLLLLAAFVAGTLNAAAGGGSFLTLPALIYAGLPPVAANATGTVALLPGYISSTFGFRDDIPREFSLWGLVAASLAGGVAGAALLVLTPNRVFDTLIPWLLLAATGAFALGPRLRRAGSEGSAASLPVVLLSVFFLALYGGYFSGGLGIALLALFSALGLADLNAANGLKNLVSALLTTIAVAVYAWGGIVSWPEALVMMLAATAGGYLGARWVRRMKPTYVRHGVIIIGLAMAVVFFAR